MSTQTKEVNLHVAPDGNDGWSGALAAENADGTDGPFASPAAALKASRELGAQVARRILMAGGDYFLKEPLLLDPQDSGLSIEAAPGEEVTLYGGRRITGWQQDGAEFWAASVPEVAEGEWDFRMLIVNGRFCQRARLPEEGHFTHLSEFAVPWMSTTGGGWKRKPTEQELTTLEYRPEDLGPWLDLRNAELTVYHMWDESVVGLSAMDTKTHTLTFANPSGHPPGAFRVQKYVVWNVREGMTEPGQWYLDRTEGKVVYWPLPGEDMTEAEVLAPTMESIIRIEGSEEEPLRNITVRGLELSVTNTPLEAGGFGAGKFEGAVSLSHAENCNLSDVEIANVGGQGLKAQNATGLTVEGCHVRDTGACGVIVRGNECRVSETRIHDAGRTYPSAIGLWSNGKHHTLSHNAIHDTPYTGIASSGSDHRIESNLIYRTMLQLHDGAGIYITFCQRVVLRGNFIRDIPDTGEYGSSAYYLDEQAEDCLVEGNLSLRVSRPSHNHMAWKNTIRNNVFIVDGNATLTFPKSTDYVFERNVLRATGNILFTNPEAVSAFRDNLLFSSAGKVEGQGMAGYDKTERTPLSLDAGSRLTAPALLQYETGEVKYVDESPALKLGVLPIDVSSAGPRGEGRGK